MKLTSTLVLASALAASMPNAATASSLLSNSQLQGLFAKYIETYDKTYETRQVLSKLATFSENLKLILEHNQKNSSYKLAMNQFGDLTQDEFAASLNMKIAEENADLLQGSLNAPKAPSALISDEFAVDWSKIVKNPVKSQQGCGSCWAFSAVSAVEYRWAIKNHLSEAISFSEQQVLDCDIFELGCSGGLISNALYYIERAGGLCQEKNYPYTAKVGTCQEKSCSRVAKPDAVKKVRGTEVDLVKELRRGPVPVAVAASTASFQFYKSGILDDAECAKSNINHAILAVGYSPAKGGQKAFLKIRNSWGSKWGEDGYIRFAFNENVCGINTSTFFGSDYFPQYN